ncbi:hypothetical protein Fmac_006364 [Flemingia macrophylla]|uniref:Uncharacterized protein n=1 Tax=Flemingia macrophylla TaxID=520843 RepID=A0ABD1NAD7_9FABA
MDVKEMVPYLNEKLKRNVEVVPPKKEENKKEKEKENKGDGDDNKKKEKGGGGGAGEEGAAKVEVNKMEHYGYAYPPAPMYWYDGYAPGDSSSSRGYAVGYDNNENDSYYASYQHGYMNQPPPFYLNPHHPPPQMFSDENPNACSLM